MLNRPKIVYLTIKNRLLHVICKGPQIYVSFGHIRKHASKHLRDT